MAKRKIKTRSAKNKGKKLQNLVCKKLSELFDIPWGVEEEIQSQLMGQSGVDVILRGKAKKLFPFSIECFLWNTLVLTDSGYKPIRNIIIGDKVLTHKGRFRKVTSIFSRKSKINKLSINSISEPIIVTKDHPFENINQEWESPTSLKYVSHFISDINENEKHIKKLFVWSKLDVTILPRKTDIPYKVELDEDLLYLFGLYIAEGYCSRYKVTWTFHKDEIEYLNKVKQIVKKKFNIDVKTVYQKESKAVHVTAHSVILAKAFKKWLDTGSYNKKIGKFLFLKKQLLSKILIGYFNGDGSVGENYARCETVSRRLAYEVHFALARFNIFSSITIASKNRDNPLYSVQISRSSLSRFKALYTGSCVKNLPFNIVSPLHPMIYNLSVGRTYSKVKYFKEYKTIKTMYNIEVEEDETYIIGGGIIVHNCKSRNKIAFYNWIDQAKANTLKGTDWLVVAKKDYKKPVVIIDLDLFLKIFKRSLK